MNNKKLLEELIIRETTNICKRYKISAGIAKKTLLRNFELYPKLINKIDERYNAEEITRLKEYKNLIKKTKEQIYYMLRQFKINQNILRELINELEEKIQASKDESEIKSTILRMLQLHVSTKERLPYYSEFYKIFFESLEDPSYILDIGCGLHPLVYPFKSVQNLKTYVAIDKDALVVDALRVFSRYTKGNKLVPLRLDITSSDWLNKISFTFNGEYDVILMLKLIPVLYRQNRRSIENLFHIPSKYILITASLESMTKYENIYAREDAILKQYIQKSNRKIKSKFMIENEFGYLLR